MQRWRACRNIIYQQRRAFQELRIRGDPLERKDSRGDPVLGIQVKSALSISKRDDGNYPTIEIEGYIRSIRKQKNVAFAVVNDGTSLDSLQAVLKPEDAATITTGAAVRLIGPLVESRGTGQDRELQVEQVDVFGPNDLENNPIQPKYQTPEFLRTVPHLRPRIPAQALGLRARSELIRQCTAWFSEHGWVQCHTPIITSSDCEGAGEVFTVDAGQTKSKDPAQVGHFFRQPKYLTVSAQLHLEALAQAVNKVWTLSPTFRAEKSDTARHLSEFYMLEAEVCFVDDMNVLMGMVELLLKHCVAGFDESITADLLKIQPEEGEGLTREKLSARWHGIRDKEWPRITYAEAIKILEAPEVIDSFEIRPSYDGGLQAEHERYLATIIGKGTPIFVTDYPKAQKPFYMAASTSTVNSRGTDDTVACFDLLVPDLGELVGGSMRKHDLIENLPGANLEWYQDLRRFGSVPHGGFGLGFDRLLCYLTGVSNIRDVVAFPRWHGRCDC